MTAASAPTGPTVAISGTLQINGISVPFTGTAVLTNLAATISFTADSPTTADSGQTTGTPP